MTEKQINKYIGKKVKITFIDNYTCTGTLAKGEIYYGFNWVENGYHLEEKRLGFKKSHVKKVEVLENDK